MNQVGHVHTHHRALTRGTDQVRVEWLRTPEPRLGELLIAPLVVGLCGTDLQMLRGLRDDPAPVIGHEGLARVVTAPGDTAEALPVGTFVTVNPTHPTDPSFLLGHNVNGLFQERTLIPAAAVEAGLVQRVPALTTIDMFALLEPLAAVRYSMELLEPLAPKSLVVFGDGAVGHLAVRAAARWLPSVKRTVLVHHTDLGLVWSQSQPSSAYTLLGPEPDREALLTTAGPGRTAAILATPRTATLQCLETALRHLPTGTVIDLFGGMPKHVWTPLLPDTDLNSVRAANQGGQPTPGALVDRRTVQGKQVWLTGHRGVANRHLLDATEELLHAPDRYRSLITHVTDLDGAATIMNKLRTDTERAEYGRRVIKLAVRVAPISELTWETRCP